MSEKHQVVLGPCEVRFPHLVSTEVFNGVDTGKFACTFVLPPDHPSVEEAEKAVAQANGGKGSNPLSVIPADSEYDPMMVKIKAKSKFRPRIVDVDNKVVEDAGRVSGSEVRAIINFVPYTQGGGGVTAYLQAIQILKEGSAGSVDFGPLPEGYSGDYGGHATPF